MYLRWSQLLVLTAATSILNGAYGFQTGQDAIVKSESSKLQNIPKIALVKRSGTRNAADAATSRISRNNPAAAVSQHAGARDTARPPTRLNKYNAPWIGDSVSHEVTSLRNEFENRLRARGYDKNTIEAEKSSLAQEIYGTKQLFKTKFGNTFDWQEAYLKDVYEAINKKLLDDDAILIAPAKPLELNRQEWEQIWDIRFSDDIRVVMRNSLNGNRASIARAQKKKRIEENRTKRLAAEMRQSWTGSKQDLDDQVMTLYDKTLNRLLNEG